MKTAPLPPVIFTAFANPHGDLSNLTQEQNGIQDALSPLEAKGKIKHLIRTDTDLNAYFDFLIRWENQLLIFHYAGHANSEAVALQNANTFFEPLAAELLARNPKSLQLVFLNGCSTYAHVQTLFKLGVPAVIASSVPINDNRAMQLATRFYGNLAQGDSIEAAYKSAANYVKGSSTEARFRNLGEIQTWRAISFREKETPEEFPWGLYVREEGLLENKGLLDFSETPAGKTAPEKTIIQTAEKIYNIEKIDNADFS